MEICFSSGQPLGGNVSNFLLEKSRVVMQNPFERGFHIFYQLCNGIGEDQRGQYGLYDPENYEYLNQHDTYKVKSTQKREQ